MATTYDIGDVVRISTAFTQSSVAIDPTTVSLVVREPDGTTTTYSYAGATVTKDSTGNYHKDLTISGSAGIYRYRWTSTGTGAASEESWFEVQPRRVAT